MTQLGFLHQGQSEAERSVRDQWGSTRRTPTPSLWKAGQGRRMPSQDEARAYAVRAETQKGAGRNESQRPALSLSLRRGSWREETRAFGTQLFGFGWHERHIRAQSLPPTPGSTHTSPWPPALTSRRCPRPPPPHLALRYPQPTPGAPALPFQ